MLSAESNQGQGDNLNLRINCAVYKICDLFNTNAEKVLTSPRRSKGRNKTHQVLFNAACKDKRKAFHRAKNRYSFMRNKENRDAMKLSGKAFFNEIL